MLQTTISSEQAKGYIDRYGIENLISNSYIHSHKETAQYGIKLANKQIISSKKNKKFFTNNAEFIQWRKQSILIRDSLRNKERELLKFLGGANFTRNDFIFLMEQAEKNLGSLYESMDKYTSEISSIKRGFKKNPDIRKINQLNTDILKELEKEINSKYNKNDKYMNIISNIYNQIKNLNSSLDNSIANFDHRENKKSTKIHVEDKKSLSIYNYITQVIPKYYEYKSGVVINNFIELLNKQLDKSILTKIIDTSGNTKINTSEDRFVKLFLDKKEINFSVSVKTSGKNVLQTKTGNLSKLLSGTSSGEIDKTDLKNIFLNLKSGNNIQAIKYIIANYIVNKDINKRDISNAIKIIALAYVNEKVFGFNKSEQYNLSLNTILDKIPLITYSSSGIHFLSDLIDNLIININKNVSNITKIYSTYNIEKSSNNNIKRYKQQAFYKLLKEKKPFVYENIINTIGKEIFQENIKKILLSSNIKIQYSVPYSF